MLLVGSANADVGMEAAWETLSRGGSALDAVEIAIRAVEDNPLDRTVGYGGLPNLLGEVELDASIIDGSTRRVGAVAGLKDYRHAITVARAVMEKTPHVLLVGDGAGQFAEEIELEREDLLTPETKQAWQRGLELTLKDFPDSDRATLDLVFAGQKAAKDYFAGEILGVPLAQAVRQATDPEKSGGTVNVIAIDSQGRLASGVSTSGWAWSYPGRVGDSPIVGGGNYADGEFGAAACTGAGELSIRAGTARTVVEGLKHGLTLKDACAAALHDLARLKDVPTESLFMAIVAVDIKGNHYAIATSAEALYAVHDGSTPNARLLPRTVIPPQNFELNWTASSSNH